ncbi:MAG: type II secretion system protein [Sulfurovum sp.]|nr:type II secretion system protein [Sulfurovum sp.]
MRRKTLRDAIAMIELIFAIVIMGIVMMSAPLLISTASKSGYVAIQQESINEVASQVNIILGYQWDENNTNESYDPIVLNTSGDGGLDENGVTGVRAGTPKESYRKFFSSTGQRGIASSIGADSGEKDDMDDFDGTQVHLQQAQSGGTSDYIETTTIDIDRTVKYMSDALISGNTYINGGGGTLSFSPTFTDGTPTTNIKRIQVTITSSSGVEELDKTITLHAFSCNIGSFALEERP